MSDAAPRFAPVALALGGLAARTLGWCPHDFWNATPAELATALAPPMPQGASGIDRATLTRLMEHDDER